MKPSHPTFTLTRISLKLNCETEYVYCCGVRNNQAQYIFYT